MLADKLVSYLYKRKFGAILFCVGRRLSERQDAAIRAIRKGFIIGNHSYDHLDFNNLDSIQAQHQITSTDAIIEALYAKANLIRPAKYFRFPYGNRGSSLEAKQFNQEMLQRLGYVAPLHSPSADWGWDVEVEDWDVRVWNARSKLRSAKECLKKLQPGSVLDLHDHEANVRWHLLSSLCETTIKLGFRFYDNAELHRQAGMRNLRQNSTRANIGSRVSISFATTNGETVKS